MNLRQSLEERLGRVPRAERPRILHGVYKQLATSHKGRQTHGLYHDFSSADPERAEELSYVIAELLERNGLPHHGARLRQQYHNHHKKFLFPHAPRFSLFMFERCGEDLRVVLERYSNVLNPGWEGEQYGVFNRGRIITDQFGSDPTTEHSRYVVQGERIGTYRYSYDLKSQDRKLWYRGIIPGLVQRESQDEGRMRGIEAKIFDETYDSREKEQKRWFSAFTTKGGILVQVKVPFPWDKK